MLIRQPDGEWVFAPDRIYMGYIDLHLHLDGSVSFATLKKLAVMQNISLPENLTAEDLSVPADCRDLNEYLSKFDLPCKLLQTKDALSFATECLLYELQSIGITYTEIRFAPQKHTEKNLTEWDAAMAVLHGYNVAKSKADVPGARFIFCLMRTDYGKSGECRTGKNNTYDYENECRKNKDKNLETVDIACTMKKRGNELCAGLDLAGAEGLYPTVQFEEEFSIARKNGVPFTIHAGEAASAESIRCALDFGAKRIGHGVRAVDDESLMKRIAKEGIVLEMCPTSNLQTKAVPCMEKFPLGEFMRHNIKCTINSDNMTVSGTNVVKEFEILKNHGFSEEILSKIQENAVHSYL